MNLNTIAIERIKNIRIERNISKTSIAKQVFLSVSAYSRIENGESSITLNMLELISKALSVDISYLLNIDDKTIVNNNNSNIIQQGTIHTLNIQLTSDQFDTLKNTFTKG